jgi:hypothetical protein
MVGIAGQAGKAPAQIGAARSPSKISYEMISAGARILEASAFCEMSPTIAEGLAEEMLVAALSAEGDRQQNISGGT